MIVEVPASKVKPVIFVNVQLPEQVIIEAPNIRVLVVAELLSKYLHETDLPFVFNVPFIK